MPYDQQIENINISSCGSRFLDERFEKPLKTIILTSNKPFSFFVVWLGSDSLLFRKDYDRNNCNFSRLLLLELPYCISPLSSTSARSTSLIKANSSYLSKQGLQSSPYRQNFFVPPNIHTFFEAPSPVTEKGYFMSGCRSMCLTGTVPARDQHIESPVVLGQLQNMTDFAQAAKAQFRLECSIAGTMKVEGKFKV
jgi:hypothetical protein